jgi:predicted nucleotidyltransferase
MVPEELPMNAPDINRAILRMHIATIEAKYPIKIVGLLPRGSVGHVFEDNALDFLAEKRPGLSLLGLSGAEVDLAEMLGRPVGIVLVSGLRDREAEEFPKIVEQV